MTNLTPERRAELRTDAENSRLFRFVTGTASDGYPSSGYESIDDDLTALLDAADERDRLQLLIDEVLSTTAPWGAPVSDLDPPDRREGAELATARAVASLMHRGAYVDGKPITWEQLPATAQAAAMAFARPAVDAALRALVWACSGCDAPEAACLDARSHGARACCPDCIHARWTGADDE